MNKVTSNKYFKPGDTVEECSLTVVREVPPSMATHTFYIDRVKKSIVDGNACLYKHEKNPNLKYSNANDLDVVDLLMEQNIISVFGGGSEIWKAKKI